MKLESRSTPDARPGAGTAALGAWLVPTLLVASIVGLACREEADSNSASPGTQPTATASKPAIPMNVVIITLDTTRADALGAYGQPLPTSRRIDQIATEGVLFEQCVTSAPNTLPAHATIFTGKEPYAHGARSNAGYVLAQGNVTLAEILKSRGYTTGAEVAAPVIGARTQLDQGFDHYRDTDSPGVELKQIKQKQGGKKVSVELDQRIGADITRSGIEFIRAHRNRPFLLWLHYFDVHMPYSAPGAYNKHIPHSPYHAGVAYVDFQVGLVVRELRLLGLKERTIVVITSDHGEGLDEHGELTHSYFVYDSTMRIPLIFWGPEELLQNWRVKSLVRAVDITPTILDWLGLPSLKDVQGTSLLPLLRGEADDLHLTGYGESIELITTFGGDLLRFVREGNWKYIHQLNPSLHDLESDPGELLNLVDQHPEITRRLKARLRALIEAAPERLQDSVQAVSAKTRAELIALGYAAEDAPAGLASELETLRLTIDLSKKTKDVSLLLKARGRFKQKDFEKAFDHFDELWERNPSNAAILAGLVATSATLNRDDAVVELMASASEIDPSNAGLFIDLAGMALRAGNTQLGVEALEHAVELDPCQRQPRRVLAEQLRQQGRPQKRYDLLLAGAQLCPDDLEFRNDLAWTLATSRDDRLRDGRRALELAAAVVTDSSGNNPGFLDTLAAAYAETDDFTAAARIEVQVIELVQDSEGDQSTLAVFREHLAAFEAGRAIRED